jgi:hypothetical protein
MMLSSFELKDNKLKDNSSQKATDKNEGLVSIGFRNPFIPLRFHLHF